MCVRLCGSHQSLCNSETRRARCLRTDNKWSSHYFQTSKGVAGVWLQEPSFLSPSSCVECIFPHFIGVRNLLLCVYNLYVFVCVFWSLKGDIPACQSNTLKFKITRLRWSKGGNRFPLASGGFRVRADGFTFRTQPVMQKHHNSSIIIS